MRLQVVIFLAMSASLCLAAPQIQAPSALWSWSSWPPQVSYIQLVHLPVVPAPAPASVPTPAPAPEAPVPLLEAPQPVQDTPEVKRAKEIFLEQYRRAALAASLAPEAENSAAAPRESLGSRDRPRDRPQDRGQDDPDRGRRAAQLAPAAAPASTFRAAEPRGLVQPWTLDSWTPSASSSSSVVRLSLDQPGLQTTAAASASAGLHLVPGDLLTVA